MTRSWGIASALTALGFAALAVMLHIAPHALSAADAPVSALATADFPIVSFFLIVTALGGGVGIIGAAICFAFIGRLSAANVFRLAALLAAVLAANKLLKEFFARARPDPLPWFDAVASFSFPSAHATSIMALYGFIAVVLYRRTKRAWSIALPVTVIALVGASRIILGAHFFTDVIGGYLIGFSLLAFALAVPFERFVRTS